jgi:hypothetical protein
MDSALGTLYVHVYFVACRALLGKANGEYVIVGQYYFETETADFTVGHCCLEAEGAQDGYKIAAGQEV